MTTWHLNAVLLPDTVPRDIWIVDGLLRLSPPDGGEHIQDLCPAGGWALPGLVDGHSHISWPHSPDVPAQTEGFMDNNRAAYARSGVALLRDMGSAFNAVIQLPGKPGLPRTYSAGHLLVLNDGMPFPPATETQLTELALAQVRLGAPWVKVFADWTPDFGGPKNPGFRGDDELTYAPDVLRAMVDAVHAAGARVAAHTFSRPGVLAALEAGVDSLEHGWALEPSDLPLLKARGTLWAPLVSIAQPMWETSHREGDMERVRWVEAAMNRLAQTLPLAAEMGVPLLAGTDWFGAVLVQDEVRALIDRGVPVEQALGAASWGALQAIAGEAPWREGAPIDLLWFERDPREQPEVLCQPGACWIQGQPVRFDLKGFRPQPPGWARRDPTRVWA